jgi:asparaginyl-tRNA synthetase
MPTIASIGRIGQYDGQDVTLRGWVTGRRSSGKLHFLQVRDGSGFIQATVFHKDVPGEVFERAEHLPQEAAVEIDGLVKADARAPGGYEIGVKDLRVVSLPESEYPITPKEHGIEFLMDHRHLWFRHRRPYAVMRIRDTVIRAVGDFFHEQGFVRFDAPFLTANAVEGTTTLFEMEVFEREKAYLTQSGQLYAEAGALAFGKVYTFGPTFRAEKSKTRRHLLEFWMIEPEVAWNDYQDNMDLQEAFVSYLVQRVLAENAAELAILEREPARLEPSAQGAYPRISYDDALEVLKQAGLDLPWGEDFGAPHETALGEAFDRPVMIHSYPAHIKAFYMEPHADPKRVKCNDMIAPDGYGEIIGGSQRIHDLALLQRKIAEHGLPESAFEWYLDLRRFGSVPHAGFGLGLERTIAWICGLDHLREAIPFPRMLTRMTP